MNKLIAIGLATLPVFPLVAQTHTIPTALTSTPGSAATAFPFGNANPAIIQYVYDSPEVGLSAPTVLRSLEIRSEELATLAGKVGVDLEIALSSTTVAAAAVTTTFTSNRGINHTVVYSRRLTNLPPTTPGFVGQYAGPFMFDAPFVHTASPTTGLLVEYNIASQPSGTWTMDTPFTGAGPHRTIGTGCSGFAALSALGAIGTNMNFTTTGGAPNNPAVLLLGMQQLPAPIPLPGGLGCNLYLAIDAYVNTVLAPSGTTTVALPVPNNMFLRGQVIFGQFGSIDAGGALISTNMRAAGINGPYDVARIYNTSNNLSLTGFVQQRVGIVTRFGL